MNYEKIYQQIIDRARTRKLNDYKEKHHIVPRCLGGNNDKENLVDLTPKEHFICHLLLANMYPTHRGLRFAIWNMINTKSATQDRYIPSCRIYNLIRQEYIQSISGIGNPMYNKTHSPTTREKMSKTRIGKYIGEDNNFYGMHHTFESIEKIRLARKHQKNNKGIKINIDGIKYKSAADASRLLNILYQTVIDRIKNPKFKTYQYAE